MCELPCPRTWPRVRAYIANDDVVEVESLLNEEHVVLGLTDAGAHVDQLCDAPSPTDLLGTWVRERGSCPSSGPFGNWPVSPLTCSDSRVGVIFAPDLPPISRCSIGEVAPGPQRRLHDLPAGGERLTNEEPVGVRHVLVNGTSIRTDELQLDLEKLRDPSHPNLGSPKAQRTARKNSRRSSVKSSGCSMAGKCPPRDRCCQRTT